MKLRPGPRTSTPMVLLGASVDDRVDPVVAVGRLYVLHGAALRQTLARLAPELDADDLVQELFVIALRNAERVVRADAPHAWLFGSAVRLAATRRRTARLRRFFGLDVLPRTAKATAVEPARDLEQRDAQRQLAAALESVSGAKRDVFVLFELQGLAGEDIATALGIPLKTVWTRLFHARKEVAAALRRQLHTEARTSGLSPEELKP